jgi:4'-phosphopantetheinyl transferase
VHVWRAGQDVESAALGRFEETLSADEQARAVRFHSFLDRTHYVAGRGTLRAIMAQYLGVPAAELRFCANTHGKPSRFPSEGAEDLRFNVSHSHGLALFTFALHREVGVDLERVRPSGKEESLAERSFSPQEIAVLRTLPTGAQAEGFFHCWTRKEAYIKARGKGLSIELSSFAPSLLGVVMSALSRPKAQIGLRCYGSGWNEGCALPMIA